MLLGFHVPTRAKAAESNTAGDVINPVNAYIRIGTDSSVTVLSAHMDGGQGSTPASPRLWRKSSKRIGRRCASRVQLATRSFMAT